jgi:SagB-type dehydrogenase family enzyme
MIRHDDPTALSLLFHLNSEPWLNQDAYQRGAPGPKPPVFPVGAEPVALPATGPSGLDALARERVSCRDFAVTTMTLSTVADLLRSGYGIVEVVAGADGARLYRHPVPSAGGLFPLELVVFQRRIDGLTDGVYRYDAVAHSLELLGTGDLFEEVLAPSLYAFPFLANANGFIAAVAVFDRNQGKYGPRGYRYALLEAGHVAQNIVLRGVELDVATLCVGGFSDRLLNAALGLDRRQAGVVYGVAFGVARTDRQVSATHDDRSG